MKKHARAWIQGLCKYGIGIGLLAYILHKHWEPKGSSPGISGLLEQTPDFAAFLALVVVFLICLTLQFLRWYALVRALDLPFTFENAFRLGLVGAFYNSFLPGSVGGDLVKAYYIAKDTPGRRASAVATVIADRLVGLFGLIWFSAAFGGGCWLAGDERIANNDYLKRIIYICTGIAVTTVAGWLVMGFLPQSRADRFSARLSRVPKLGNTLAEVWGVVWTYRQRPRVIYSTVAMTAIVHLGFVVMYHLAVRVFPSIDPATLQEHFVIAPIGFIAQAFFPAPGGLGGGEFVFGYLYTLLGRPEETGVVGRLALRVVEWAIGLVGLVIWLRMKAHHELPEEEPEKADGGIPATAPLTETRTIPPIAAPIEGGVSGASIGLGFFSCIVFWWFPFSPILSFVGLTLGLIALARGARGPRGENFALGGTLLCATSLSLTVTLNFVLRYLQWDSLL